MQLSLLDQFCPAPDARFATVTRHDLGAGAWVDYGSSWLCGQDKFFQLLVATADWEKHRRVMFDRVVEVPRLVAGAPGSEPGIEFEDEDEDEDVERRRTTAAPQRVKEARDALAKMAALLSMRYQRALDSVTLGYYRDGRDSVSFHGDKMGALRSDTIVAIVSVGESRKFLLRSASSRRTPRSARSTRAFHFSGGDLLVMGGTCQETWEHSVPKMARCGPRVSIMFREKIPALMRRHASGSRMSESEAWRNIRNAPSPTETRFAATGRRF